MRGVEFKENLGYGKKIWSSFGVRSVGEIELSKDI